jgi:hypothetical protein
MEGWPTEIVFFSSVFLSFFTWSSLCALLVCIVLVDTRRRATAPVFFLLFNKKGFFSIGGNKDFIGVAI